MTALGRRIPYDWDHVLKYPLSTLIARETDPLVVPPDGTEKNLGLPWWWKRHDQGQEGACVGFGCSAMMSITNHKQRLMNTGQNITYRYDSRWLYLEAQLIDEWDSTPPEEGTSVKAGCEILRTRGHKRIQGDLVGLENLAHGIDTYRWATTVDEVRAAIYGNLSVAIGVNWYTNFDDPVTIDSELWIGTGDLGAVRGGHCVALFRMSDSREAFRLMNSWGEFYPTVWLPYNILERLINEYGEVAVITDR